jgi:hypothetical protein
MVRVSAYIKTSAIQASSSAYQVSDVELLQQSSPPPLDADAMPCDSLVSSVARRLALALATFASMMRGVDASQNATVCPTDQLDWYTSVVGETPCRTYERLRQICDEQCARCSLRDRSLLMVLFALRRHGRHVQLNRAR